MHVRNHLIVLLAVLGSFFPSPGKADNELARNLRKEAKIYEVAYSAQWLRLLHYKPATFFRATQSRAVQSGFFLSPNGKYDPKAELLADIEGFRGTAEIGKLHQHPQCAFPVRYDFLKKQLGLDIQDVPCKKLDEFLSDFHAKSVSVVFSTAYPNSPGSMFGHTLLKFKGDRGSEMLDLSIGYAAYVGQDAGFDYMIRGVFGGYTGEFSLMPYYAKINEYINSESRDLWEYELSFTPEETRTLLKHLWELETNATFQYYFFDENCAFMLLAAMEAIKPDWNLLQIGPYLTPGESIRKLVQTPGAIHAVHFRPSLRKKLEQVYETLNSQDKKLFWNVVEGKRSVAETPNSRINETLNLYFQYLKQKNEGVLDADQKRLVRDILMQRSVISEDHSAAPLPPIPEDSRPDLGHYPYLLGAGGGALQMGSSQGLGQTFEELHFKFALHDLMNDDLGYIKNSQIDFPGATLRYYQNPGRLTIDSIQPIAITSLFPLTDLDRRPSWKVEADYRSPKDFGCFDCHVVHFGAGAGGAVELGTPRVLGYSLLSIQAEAGSSLMPEYRILPELSGAFLLNPLDRYKLHLFGAIDLDAPHTDRSLYFTTFKIQQSYSFSLHWDVRTDFTWILPSNSALAPTARELKLSLNSYF